MEMMVQFISNLKQPYQYCRERFQLVRFVPLTMLLYYGYLLSVGFTSVSLVDFVMFFLLLLFFRLIDDLFDRDIDKRTNPERLLARTEEMRPFLIFLGFLFCTISALFYINTKFLSGIIFSAVIATFAIWYVALRQIFGNHLFHTAVILLKYPLFLFIMAPAQINWAVALLVYFNLLIFELQDDPLFSKHHPIREILTLVRLLYLLCLAALLWSFPGIFSFFILTGLAILLFSKIDHQTTLGSYQSFFVTLLAFSYFTARDIYNGLF